MSLQPQDINDPKYRTKEYFDRLQRNNHTPFNRCYCTIGVIAEYRSPSPGIVKIHTVEEFTEQKHLYLEYRLPRFCG